MSRDISELTKVIDQLSKSEKLYRNLFNSSPFLIGLLNKEGILININDKVEDFLSIHTKQDVIGKYFKDILRFNEKNRALIPTFEDYFKKILKGEKPPSFDFILYRSKEGYFWCRFDCSLVKLDNEDIIQFIAQNITDYKEAGQKLKESEEKFAKAFNSNALSMSISTIEEGLIIEVNDVFLQDLGFKREEVIGKTSKELNLWVDRSQRDSMIKILKEKGSVVNMQIEYRTKEGKIKYGLFSEQIITLNEKPYLLNIVNDITDRVRYERKLKESEKKFRDAYNRVEFYKDIFSHDINNMLQSILSSNQLISMLPTSEEQKERLQGFLNIISSEVNRGKKLVKSIKKLSQIEEHEIVIEKIEVFSILNKSIRKIKDSTKDKKVKIQIDFTKEECYLQANNLIKDLFENIIINSIRHNRHDDVEITIKISGLKEEGINYCKMEFIDNGIGIEDIRKNIIFYRASSEIKQIYGIGLGLSLVYNIIEAYKGKIWVEDRVKGDYSKGSNFIILIPEGEING